jgi:hypothetical protein
MDRHHHPLSDLFAQLGLASDPRSVSAFIRRHGPLDGDMRFHDAPFWNASQRALLHEALADDADWSGVGDQLNASMHA